MVEGSSRVGQRLLISVWLQWQDSILRRSGVSWVACGPGSQWLIKPQGPREDLYLGAV